MPSYLKSFHQMDAVTQYFMLEMIVQLYAEERTMMGSSAESSELFDALCRTGALAEKARLIRFYVLQQHAIVTKAAGSSAMNPTYDLTVFPANNGRKLFNIIVRVLQAGAQFPLSTAAQSGTTALPLNSLNESLVGAAQFGFDETGCVQGQAQLTSDLAQVRASIDSTDAMQAAMQALQEGTVDTSLTGTVEVTPTTAAEMGCQIAGSDCTEENLLTTIQRVVSHVGWAEKTGGDKQRPTGFDAILKACNDADHATSRKLGDVRRIAAVKCPSDSSASFRQIFGGVSGETNDVYQALQRFNPEAPWTFESVAADLESIESNLNASVTAAAG